MNEHRTCTNSDTPLARRRSRPVRYRLISPHGDVAVGTYETAREAASAAGGFWPGVGQREEDSGRAGWNIEAVP